MSKINAVRLINLNYNNNAIRISDETFDFHGDSTLLSLQNGGGKTVLVQMISSLFVHPRYRKTKDRPFESYFTTNRPTFILVEWRLDHSDRRVLTGMMVRRNQNVDSIKMYALEMVQFISEYTGSCMEDIHNLPVVEKKKDGIVLKSYGTCRQILEGFKKDRTKKFFCYDMNNMAQRQQYYAKLGEYQINHKEWETIIHKINLKESGLSDLFADCRDERGLVEKWFLDAVESKLNHEGNRIGEFENILRKYVIQFRANREKIARRDTINLFKQEADSIYHRIEDCEAEAARRQSQENQIADYIYQLDKLKQQTDENIEKASEETEALITKKSRVDYEDYSLQILHKNEDLSYEMGNRDMVALEKDTVEKKRSDAERRLHILELARQQAHVDDSRRESRLLKEKIKVQKTKNKDLEPERHLLGRNLYKHYHTAALANVSRTEELHSQIDLCRNEEKAEQDKLLRYDGELQTAFVRKGSLKTKIQSYDTVEKRYNDTWQAACTRNILGEYEAGYLDITREEQKKQNIQYERQRHRLASQMEESRENIRTLRRLQDDCRERRIHLEAEKKDLEREQKAFEKEREIRRRILSYVELDESALYETGQILTSLRSKIAELQVIRRQLEAEEQILLDEERRLEEGIILELPERMKQAMADQGMAIVYGMEWLRKSDMSEAEKQAMVKNHPFLPYSIIVTANDMEKIHRISGITTSTPIPLTPRNSLKVPFVSKDDLQSGDGPRTSSSMEEDKMQARVASEIITSGDMSFYLYFDENLLNPTKVAELLEKYRFQLEKKQEEIARRTEEIAEYSEKLTILRGQKLTKERYENLLEDIGKLEQEQEDCRKELAENQRNLAEALSVLENQEEQCLHVEDAMRRFSLQMESFENLVREYGLYLDSRTQLNQCTEEIARLENRKEIARSRIAEFAEKRESLSNQLRTAEAEATELQRSLQKYENYETETDSSAAEAFSPLPEEELLTMESRFEAITSRMSMELQLLEEQEQKERNRLERVTQELQHLAGKYQLEPSDWSGCIYDRQEEFHYEKVAEEARTLFSKKHEQWHQIQTNIALIEQTLSELSRQMFRTTGESVPVAAAEIVDTDFDGRRNKILYQIEEKHKEIEKYREMSEAYSENLTTLAEYTFARDEEECITVTVSQMNREELRRFQGTLVRDYREILARQQKLSGHLRDSLHRMIRMEGFQEDYYQKPLENMLRLAETEQDVREQLDTTILSYDSLMEKIQVDISLVEEEKQRIKELLSDYIHTVHDNLGMIDDNSTITIRERSIKMLKIEVPRWEEQEQLYELRLEDCIDEITAGGIALLDENKNTEDYFSRKITTKNLYEQIVGIQNVRIRLYKIEAEREYPITWAEVSRNSGGEGFLSAFVILTSLLCYMRRDETDIFADKNEGKVLIMDNPFAQTSASHLLKPLMDIAKKTNTQLICLTGLSGESIYNRFDNIYVLNLIHSNLKNGACYLKGDHRRGKEDTEIVTAQIETYEQISLGIW